MYRVGSLDAPERLGRRSVAVYMSANGLFTILDGSRTKVRANTRWTSLYDVKMRGEEPISEPVSLAPTTDATQGEDAQLAAAIAASLRDAHGGSVDPPIEATQGGNVTSVGDTPDSAQCAICLTEPRSVLSRPCMHVVMCEACSRRMLRQPCVICRRNVTKIEKVFL